jgi:glycosyltransferase involved in cell wall biosynthesis
MNILYVSRTCSTTSFNRIFEESKIKPQQQAQKFHSLFIKGLEQVNNLIYVMSTLPISGSFQHKKWVSNDKETEGNTEYCYLPFLNLPVLKHLFIFIFSFLTLIQWNFNSKKNSKLIICDVLSVTSSIASLMASKIFRVKSVAIVTDVPNYMVDYTTQKKSIIKVLMTKLYVATCNYFITKYDHYIFLTEQMNQLVNPKHKPYVVIEGMVDSDMKYHSNNLEEKYREKVIIYAGALFEKYGVKKLIQAFMKLEMPESRLWLFGSGELIDDIIKYERIDSRIKYFGVIPNNEVVKEEMRATLLVNPRPSAEEFTQFSFPSKNMEYMVSGTPVVTTKLQGMPQEYLDYVYLFQNESEEGITETLNNILNSHEMDLYTKGKMAKNFVLNEKSNIFQSRKFIENFLSSYCKN